MGGSGAGKSTLLNIISGKFGLKKNMRLSGKVLINKEKMKWEKFRNVTGFVMQKDIFMDVLTVREIFQFVVNLKNFELSKTQKK